jgi:hypothetical protein
MKIFLKKIVLFLVLFFITCCVLQLLVNARIKNKTLTGLDNLDLSGQQNDLLFMGNSRCFEHFDPVLFERVFHLKAMNLGIDGHSELVLVKLRLRQYLSKNKAPKFIILSVDPFLRAGSLDNNFNFLYKEAFARYAFLNSPVNEPILSFFKFRKIERYLPLYALLRYQMLQQCFTLSNNKTFSRNRYGKHDEPWDTTVFTVNNSPAVIKQYFDTASYEVKEVKNALYDLNRLCRGAKIQLIAIQTPVYQSIYQKGTFDYIKRLCADGEIPFFDLNVPVLDNNMDNFWNLDHLNTKGVHRMTQVLLSDSAFVRLFTAQPH